MKRLLIVALLCAPIAAHAQSVSPNDIAKEIGAGTQHLTNGQQFLIEARKKFGSPKKCIDEEMKKNKDLGITVTVDDYEKITSDCNSAGFMLGIY